MTSARSARRAPPALDVVIVGAGILGLASARELLARHPQLRVAVLDGESAVAAHQSGHNSGVIHAGIYYQPGSLKARLCVQGAAAMYAYCERHEIPFARVGKLIVASERDELPRLDALQQRGRENGVPGLRRLAATEIAEVEPSAVGVAALHSPNTGIVDFSAVARRLAQDVREAGGELLLGRRVTDVRTRADGVELEHRGGAVVAAHAVFCAGAWSDRLAVAAGVAPDLRIVPFRGQYLALKAPARRLVRGLIYPVPDPTLPFLGVHLTRHISGAVWLGPTALMVGARDAYRLRRVRAADLGSSLAWPGSWRMMRRFWRAGLGELRLAASRRAFVAQCRRYVPEIALGDIEDGPAGVRAQAVDRAGRLVDDFVFASATRTLHVLNAPSPAATSSLAIAAVIADRAGEMLELPGGGRR